jgi:hypothetical protein
MKRAIECLTTSMAMAWFALPAIAQPRDEPLTETTAGGPLADTGTKDGEAAAGEDTGGIGINVDFEAASTFVFRGLNLFGDKQTDQSASLFPSVTVSAGRVSAGYWGAYQLSGDNARRKVEEGFSAENDLWVSYEDSVGDLGYSASLMYYVFPFADEAAAGTAAPMYLEPGVAMSYSTAVDLGLEVSYFRGLQAATQSLSYVYISPSVTRDIGLTSSVELNLGGSFGYKLWTNDSEAEDNTYHVQLDVGVTIPFGSAYVAPVAHFAATNLADLGFGDEFVVWAGFHLGGNADEI